MSIFDRYLAKHGHLPRVILSRRRSAYAGNGYIAIEEAGHRIYITRADLPKFLKWATAVTLQMDVSFDPRAAMKRALDHEEQLRRDQRLAKKQRRPGPYRGLR